jgi:hypothetical protein
MKKLIAAAVAVAIATGFGCNESPRGGSPGTDSTFKLQAPTLSTDIKQGETKVVKITVNRDDKFNQTVNLSVRGEPSGVTARLDKTSVPPSEKEVNLTITAGTDAPLGEHTLTVVGKPETGNPTEVGVKIDVEKP